MSPFEIVGLVLGILVVAYELVAAFTGWMPTISEEYWRLGNIGHLLLGFLVYHLVVDVPRKYRRRA